MADQRRAGAADQVFGEGVATLGESQRHDHLAVGDFDIMHHADLDEIAVGFGGMVHLPQGLQNVFFAHYSFTRFISLRR